MAAALDLDQGATLNLTGGEINDNDFAGVILHNGSQFTPLAHTIANASMKQNLSAAIQCEANASVTLRGKVHSWTERAAVQGAAWSAPGVNRVVNELKVEG